MTIDMNLYVNSQLYVNSHEFICEFTWLNSYKWIHVNSINEFTYKIMVEFIDLKLIQIQAHSA